MYVRYKKNIQENDLPRKRVRKASKIAGSGGQHLEIRYPERGRKLYYMIEELETKAFGNKIPREGTETFHYNVFETLFYHYLEIRYPERGRKPARGMHGVDSMKSFGNKIPREGTETISSASNKKHHLDLEIRYPERGRKPVHTVFQPVTTNNIWK